MVFFLEKRYFGRKKSACGTPEAEENGVFSEKRRFWPKRKAPAARLRPRNVVFCQKKGACGTPEAEERHLVMPRAHLVMPKAHLVMPEAHLVMPEAHLVMPKAKTKCQKPIWSCL